MILTYVLKKIMNERNKVIRKARRFKSEADWAYHRRSGNQSNNIKICQDKFLPKLIKQKIGNP